MQATLATLQMTKTITMVSSNTDMVLSLRWREARTIRDLKNFFIEGIFIEKILDLTCINYEIDLCVTG